MNKFIKKLIKIADKKGMEVISISPLFKEEPTFKVFLKLLKEANETNNIKMDYIYIIWSDLADLLLVPILEEKIQEDISIKISSTILDALLNKSFTLGFEEEEREIEIEEKTKYYN